MCKFFDDDLRRSLSWMQMAGSSLSSLAALPADCRYSLLPVFSHFSASVSIFSYIFSSCANLHHFLSSDFSPQLDDPSKRAFVGRQWEIEERAVYLDENDRISDWLWANANILCLAQVRYSYMFHYVI